jgi:Cu/Ag efflux protein CusF
MIRTPTWLTLALVLGLSLIITRSALAADKIKSVSANDKQFVVTNQEGKDITLHLADDARIFLPKGKDGSLSDLKAGQKVSYLWQEKDGKYFATAILEHSGDYQDAMLAQATLKEVGATGNEITVTDTNKKDWAFQMADNGKVTLNNKSIKLSELKSGDKVILIFAKKGEKLQALGVCSDRR